MDDIEKPESRDQVSEEGQLIHASEETYEEQAKPKKRHSVLTWIGVSAGGVCVIGLAAFGIYRWHETKVMNQFIQTGEGQIASGDYSGAVQSFQNALRYGNTPTLQQDLKNAKALVQSQSEFLLGKSSYEQHDWASAATHLHNVIPSDKQDYQQAQQLIGKAELASALDKVQKDLADLADASSKFIDDTNSLVGPWNKLNTDEYSANGMFQQDVTSFATSFKSATSDAQDIQNAIANLNTDAQSITDKSITPIIQTLENDLNGYEKDVNDMMTILSGVQTSIQNTENGMYQNFNINSFQWNADESDITKMSSLIVNDTAKLKAYMPDTAPSGNA